MKPPSVFEVTAHLALTIESRLAASDRKFIVDLARRYSRDIEPGRDSRGEYHSSVEAIVERCWPGRAAQIQAELEAAGEALTKSGHPGPAVEDIACNRWSRHIDAAVAFGVTLGLAIAFEPDGGAR